MKYLTPLFLTLLLAWWLATQALPKLLMEGVPPENVGTIWLSRLFMIGMFTVGCVLVWRAWSRKSPEPAPVDETIRVQ